MSQMLWSERIGNKSRFESGLATKQKGLSLCREAEIMQTAALPLMG